MCFEFVISVTSFNRAVIVCVCPASAFLRLFLAFCRGIKATRDLGYVVYSYVLWLADADGDFMCLPQQNCGQKVWDAWNSRDSVLPIRPNTTSISALLISKSREARKKPQDTSAGRSWYTFQVCKDLFFTSLFHNGPEYEPFYAAAGTQTLLRHLGCNHLSL